MKTDFASLNAYIAVSGTVLAALNFVLASTSRPIMIANAMLTSVELSRGQD